MKWPGQIRIASVYGNALTLERAGDAQFVQPGDWITVSYRAHATRDQMRPGRARVSRSCIDTGVVFVESIYAITGACASDWLYVEINECHRAGERWSPYPWSPHP